MTTPNASSAGRFKIGGARAVTRLGFGAMRITGPGIWGEPADRAEVLRTLETAVKLGVDFIDTADSYGPETSERLIREALHPYAGLFVATKGGCMRPGPDQWVQNGRPDYLIERALRSREILGVERIDLWQLHRIDPKVPRAEQFAAIRQLLDDGVIRHAGLSEVSIEDIEAARAVFPVATVQNRYHLADRAAENVLRYCEAHGIGFIPLYPLAAGGLRGSGTALAAIARKHAATPGQIALAWLLERSPVMLPIPGTSQRAHLEENVAAAAIELSEADLAALERTNAA